MSESNITYIISFDVKKKYLTEFAEIMASVKQDLPSVEGCSGVSIYRDADEHNNYTLVEKWKAKGLHEKHIKSLIDNGSWNHISGLLAAEPVGSYFNEHLTP